MKTKLGWGLKIVVVAALAFMANLLSQAPAAEARVTDTNPITDQRWIISEIYTGNDNLTGSYIELYNNSDTLALGYQDFVLNLPFDATDLLGSLAIGDFQTYKPHAYKKLSFNENGNWTSWLARKYIQIMYGDDAFHEIEDALDEQPTYSYQRCQTTLDDGSRVLSNKFYYGKKTPGKEIECDDKSVISTDPDDYIAGQCTNLKLNEIGSYLYPEDQFIELKNTGNQPINLSNCYLAKSKTDSAIHYQMDDYDLQPGELYNLPVEETDLESITKTTGIIYLIDSDDETVVDYKRYTGSREDTSTAIDEDGVWQITYQLTPGEPNVIEKYPACPDGQYRDEDTHRCRDLPDEDKDSDSGNDSADEDGLVPCKEGYERNPLTNRCRKIYEDDEELDENGLKPCKEGYERNPETNRCRKIATDDEDELTPCREGYTRNPETNRCVKIKTNESTLTPCKEGYTRNPETNRCVKIKKDEDDLVPCKEGYERNPETNRCVKKKTTENSDKDGDGKDDDAQYPVTTNGSSGSSGMDSSTLSLIIVISTLAVGSAGIIIYQYRHEISRWWSKLANQQKVAKQSAANKVPLTAEPDQQSTSDWLDKLSSDDENEGN